MSWADLMDQDQGDQANYYYNFFNWSVSGLLSLTSMFSVHIYAHFHNDSLIHLLFAYFAIRQSEISLL